MPTKPSPLLCEFHAHTTWSDGRLTVRALCDLYGLHGFVSAGLEVALAAARAHGAALVAAHPYSPEQLAAATRGTAAFAARPELAELVDRFELFNRHTLFSWVAAAGHATVATGDLHQPEHLASWKTLLPCPKDEPSVIAYLRSSRPAYLVRLEDELQAAA